MRKIVVETIPHKNQRYPTVGDWFTRKGISRFRISKLPDWRWEFLVMIHELIEWALCQHERISEPGITAFDENSKKTARAAPIRWMPSRAIIPTPRTESSTSWRPRSNACSRTRSTSTGKNMSTSSMISKLIAALQKLVVALQNYQKKMDNQPENLLWDTPDNSRHSVRVICDNLGMPLVPTFNVDGKLHLLKDVLCACIQVESGFNNNVKPHLNIDKTGRVWSRDWGICQVNDYWHIGAGKDFPSVDYVIANPDLVVAWMGKAFIGNQMNLWSSYTSGAFKKYLPQ